MKAYNVYLNKKNIDTVFQNASGKNKAERERDVYLSLVNHDCYNPNIIVKEQRQKKVKSKWEKQGRAFYRDGAEMFYINRCELENTCFNMTPCEADAMSYFILEALQKGDFQKFYNDYMKK